MAKSPTKTSKKASTEPVVESDRDESPTAANAPLSARALGRATLARQLLLAREETNVVGAIERLAGMQAQLPRPPYIGLWSRIAGFRAEDLTRAVAARQVVRATMWRGTLHLVSARDYLAQRAAIQAGLTAGIFAILRERGVGLDVDAVVAAAKPYFGEAPRTFTDARDLLSRLPAHARPPSNVDVRAMAFAVRLTLPLVQVPLAGAGAGAGPAPESKGAKASRATDADKARWGFATTPPFTLAETWLGQSLHPTGDVEALVLRYLAAFGPATARDMQTWSGLPAPLVRAAFDALAPKLLALRDDRKRELFDLPKAPRPGDDAVAPARFLPEFDNLVLAHADRRRFLADIHRKRVYLPGLRVAPTFWVDGVVAGTWALERKKATATLTLEPFAALSKVPQRELEREGHALARFVEPGASTFDVRFAKPRA